ncbi:MAG: hypothetical protein PVH61_07890 [Candidatus Aminicenantes bacterium]|jgi:hypothetical protein
MKIFLFTGVMLMLVFTLACKGTDTGNYIQYKSLSRFTDPGDFSSMLDKLPDDVIGICEIAKQQMIHHNLLPYYGIPKSKWKEMNNIWPPRMNDLLEALKDTEPHNLYDQRKPEQRIIGSCMKESHLLAGMLRYKNIPVRIRAGFFKDIRANSAHVIKFWEKVSKEKGSEAELLEKDPVKWKEVNNAYTKKQNDVNHYIEHWICEYWDKNQEKWRLLDANNTFLKAHSDIDVGFHLPKKHFEYACEAWKKMRRNDHFNPDQYAEGQKDGRSHIRTYLLWDFYSLLNHDIAGYDQQSRSSLQFINERKYEEISTLELEELDMLANLLAQDPTKDEIAAFYRRCKTLRLESVEKDPYSFVFSK